MTTTAATPVKPADARVLTLADNCDACGYTSDTDTSGHVHHGPIATAYVLVTFPNGHELQLCGHHYHEHELALVSARATVSIDQRASLTVKPGYSA